MLRMPVENLDLEMSNSNLDLLELFRKHPFTKDISFGVVDVHNHAIEKTEVVVERLRKALGVLKPEQVWVDPDCGLKTRTVEEAVDKLRVCAEAARALRARK
jgi:5-methyltetrahydropteroyltriglutamate--homocysteine methyltransferase